MSSSSSSPKGKGNASDDDVAMDAPDSPPDFGSSIAAAWQPFKDAQPSQQANTGSRVNGDTKVHFGAPGSSWQTKKFSEEYERAEGSLLDKSWNSTQYGDPLSSQ